ncbi:hypothetical protein [Massilia sp. PWRC2]|uniref:hypothetical protein n=1 Tax=Massilia sp. PWRC2 TaxID=2804626 RepID=UPI003CEA1C19
MKLHRVKDLPTVLLAVASLVAGVMALALPAPQQAAPLDGTDASVQMRRPGLPSYRGQSDSPSFAMTDDDALQTSLVVHKIRVISE